MGYDDPVDPAVDDGGEPDYPAAGGSIYADALDSLAQDETAYDVDAGAGGHGDLDDVDTGGLSGLLGMFNDEPASAPVGPGLVVAPSVLPPPPPLPLATPPMTDGPTPPAVQPAADFPPPPSPPEESGSESAPGASGDPIRLPVADAYCGMCGMHVPIDQARGRCHIGHRLAGDAGETGGAGRKGRFGRG